ncbi:2'-5' RNA ligase family protein [Calidithermus roseus]|uniref:Putative phosphoesterase YjcG n=1 Tax=Calidithermus roseus TaxID=1644118 RepID=A0A399EVX3_9DEIN|nr:2'-5' RNA ligase family protein [Calidithermus roseus]RIH86381.1 putative phosphoesterase YjcG [Calidithermus roseus]
MYGILVWPPEELGAFLLELQRQHRVRGFGPPHLNLRQPFEWEHGEESLRKAVQGILRSHAPFRLRLGGWSSFPQGVVYLRAYGGTPFRKLHHALEPLAPPLKEIEGPSYIPHLTLALGLSPEAAADLARSLPLPQCKSFVLREAALVQDAADGSLVEVARFPFSG